MHGEALERLKSSLMLLKQHVIDPIVSITDLQETYNLDVSGDLNMRLQKLAAYASLSAHYYFH